MSNENENYSESEIHDIIMEWCENIKPEMAKASVTGKASGKGYKVPVTRLDYLRSNVRWCELALQAAKNNLNRHIEG